MDPHAAAEHKRKNWGLGPEAIADAARKDAMWGAFTHELPEEVSA